MEIWFTVCLLAAAAMLIVFRDSPVVESAMLGIFAGLVMIAVYPLMPLVAKGVTIPLTLSMTEVLIKGMGWLIVLFPVSMFFLLYIHRLPIKILMLFKTVLTFTICYNVILGLVIFRSMWMMVLLTVLVFSIVFLLMFGFGWAIRGFQYVAGMSSPQGDAVDEKA
ncbi:MAG: hypothetical protein Q7S78_01225 [Candidatus Azambacteria bacterium]|nr:hypothetical protein [Candidatus Azambacteria bacterium]